MKKQDEGLSVSKDLSIEERKKILLDTQIDKDKLMLDLIYTIQEVALWQKLPMMKQ